MTLEGGGKFDKKADDIERITSAAIKYRGEIYTGASHYFAWIQMTEKHPDSAMEAPGREDGFMTSTGRFVGREEALEIADAADQLKSSAELDWGELRSESLKENEE